jgi:hypothetical protein
VGGVSLRQASLSPIEDSSALASCLTEETGESHFPCLKALKLVPSPLQASKLNGRWKSLSPFRLGKL